MAKKTSVLFLCTHNSARSQIAEAILNHLFPNEYEAYSAGTKPTQVNPFTTQVLNELNIDITHHRAKSITEFKNKQFDIVVTVCNKAKETCPFFPGKNIIHQTFDDPTKTDGNPDEILQKFRTLRNEIHRWITIKFEKLDIHHPIK